MTKFIITNFQSHNVRSPLIENKKDHCIMYPNETTSVYICYRKTISTQSQKCTKFTHKIHKMAILIRHFMHVP